MSHIEHSQKLLISKPLPRQEWVDGKFVKHHDHDESWVELFIDLVYVLLLSSLAHSLVTCNMSVLVFFRTSLLFWIICLTRHAVDEYTNRFFCKDLCHKSIFLLYAIGICIQVYSFAILTFDNIESSGDCGIKSSDFSTGFAAGLLVTRLCLAMFYLPVLYFYPNARNQFKFDFLRWTTTSVLSIVLLILNSFGAGSESLNFIVFALIVSNELSVWLISRVFYRHYFLFPVELGLLQSRWGTWVMIIVGESFLQLFASIAKAVEHSQGSYNFMWFIFLSMLLLYSIGMQYFDACHVEWFLHALTKSAVAGVSWVWLHVPMTYYLFRMGLWLNVLADAYANHSLVSRSDAGMFSACLGIVTALLTFIRMSNAMPDSSTSLVYHVISMEFRIIATYATRFVVAALHIVVGFIGIRDPLDLLVIQCGVSILTTCIDVYNSMKHNEALRKEEEARRQSNLKLKSLRQFPRQWSRLQLYSKESVLQLNLLDDSGISCGDGALAKLPRTCDTVDADVAEAIATIDLKHEIHKAVLESQRSAHFDGLLLRGEESMKRLSSFKTSSNRSLVIDEPSEKDSTQRTRVKFPALFRTQASRAQVHMLANIKDASFEDSSREQLSEHDVAVFDQEQHHVDGGNAAVLMGAVHSRIFREIDGLATLVDLEENVVSYKGSQVGFLNTGTESTKVYDSNSVGGEDVGLCNTMKM